MNVTQHRVLAGAILLCGLEGAAVAARGLIADPPAVVRLRERLAGKWVATRVAVTAQNEVRGAEAATTTVEFRERDLIAHNLVDADPLAQGVVTFDSTPGPLTRFDAKLDAGWLRGVIRADGDTLVVCTNALRLSEQLGVPTRGWPSTLGPAEGRYLYEFRRARD